MAASPAPATSERLCRRRPSIVTIGRGRRQGCAAPPILTRPAFRCAPLQPRQNRHLRLRLELVALDAVQFPHQALENDRADITRGRWWHRHQVGRCPDSERVQSRRQRRPYPPHLLDRPLSKETGAQLGVVEIHDTIPNLLGRLREGVRDLRQGARRAKPDSRRKASLAQDRRAQLMRRRHIPQAVG